MRLASLALLSIALAACAAAGEQPAARTVKDACLAPAAWYTFDTGAPRPTRAEPLLRDMAARQVVLLGEQHDSVEHHAWQLQTLAALHLMRPQLVIGFESFPRRVQPVLDRWVAGELTSRQFLEQAEWEKVWNFPPSLYMPLFEFARVNRIPMIALNVDRRLTEAVRARGWDAVPLDQKEGVSRPAAPAPAYENMLYQVFLAHARDGQSRSAGRDDPAFRYFVESQTTWDRAMAEAIAARVRAGEGGTPPLVAGIMGSGHVRHGHGVAHQLRDLGVQDVGILLPVNGTTDCAELKPGLAHAVFAAAPAPAGPTPPPRLGVQLGARDGDVEIAAVTRGSLAELSGLRAGDRIVTVAGTPVKNAARVVAAVRAQPAGTWLPIQIRRGEETLDVVIRFPPPL
jgi:uncharacterized iron-regulated protein